MASNSQIRVDLSSSIPVNRQIVDQLRTLLVNGELKRGDALPSVRRLAIDLGVHFNTVADAYRTLANEGWLKIAHGSGAQVIDRSIEPANEDTYCTFQQRLRQLVAEARAQGIAAPNIAQELLSLAEGLKT